MEAPKPSKPSYQKNDADKANHLTENINQHELKRELQQPQLQEDETEGAINKVASAQDHLNVA